MKFFGALCCFVVAIVAYAQPHLSDTPPLKDRIGVEQKLDSRLSLDLPFRDENGKEVKLGDYFGTKPVLLIPVFYNCQGVCRMILNGVITAFNGMRKFDVGRDFEAITFSIHPKEQPELALKTKNEVLKLYNRSTASAGWHFLTGDLPAITKLTDEIGFKYWYDPKKNRIDHPAAIMVVTPDGVVSRYFVDKDYPSRLLLNSLVSAGERKIGQKVEEKFFGCWQVDPETGKQSLNFLRITMLLCMLTFGIVCTWITTLSIKNRRKIIDPMAEHQGGNSS